MIVAIDGPSGSGKSSISKIIAKKLNLEHLDTGAMYRMLAYKMYKDNISVDKALEEFNIDIKADKFFLDGEDVSKKIRENEISKMASDVSKIQKVREFMVNMQRKLSESKSVILDGRDIGTVVFPNADYKIYLTASAEKRAMRRYLEDKTVDYDKILTDILARDKQDMNRAHSPLKKADDAIEIDSSNMSIDQVVDRIMEIIKG